MSGAYDVGLTTNASFPGVSRGQSNSILQWQPQRFRENRQATSTTPRAAPRLRRSSVPMHTSEMAARQL
ncbi:hypothetical protein ABH945_001740 [Paraburkholderia sp. GAS333]